MNFNLDRWVGHITENAIKQISEAFGKRLKDTGVTRIQWIAMFYINKHEMISPRELSKIMNVQDSSATRLIERMEKEDLMEKIPSEKDTRVTVEKLTCIPVRKDNIRSDFRGYILVHHEVHEEHSIHSI